jgi:hypothetical protein
MNSVIKVNIQKAMDESIQKALEKALSSQDLITKIGNIVSVDIKQQFKTFKQNYPQNNNSQQKNNQS